MVYCGKASQGCQNCRIRRIKLSLMFRDESTKVIKKAHAQWGVSDGPDNEQTQASASNAPSPPASSPAYSRKNSTSPTVLPVVKQENRESSPPTMHIGPTLEEQGVQFYVNRYLIGHPDEPKSGQDLATEGWIWHPAVQDVMCAVGLAGLYNLTGNMKMMATAREKYGSALRQTGKLIRPPHTPSIDVTMRSVVALAMFEVVKGTHHSIGTVHAHVMGGAALMRSWCPMPSVPFAGFRALLQLCYSMFIPLHVAGMPMPPDFYDWVSYGSRLQMPIDRPSTDLAVLIARFVEVSSFIHNHVISDGKLKTANVLQQLLDLESDLASWEAALEGDWLYETIHATQLSSKAVFEGEYHQYHDVWTARIWNYYRWARILVNQSLLDLANNNPISSLSLVSAAARDNYLANIRRLARDTLVSAPTHWRHPSLDGPAQISVESPGGGGAGSAGLPALLFHLKVAGCAPGVPKEYWGWALGVIQTIWGNMGMLHARSMMEAMRAHEDTVLRSSAAGILADDW
ncbi:hypothetical protein LZ30DRAFT_605466 [Colletotrichum cereale]|nr:hypothetical protein LZ30DRAFT_605466 [Colletotrichum cereale]